MPVGSREFTWPWPRAAFPHRRHGWTEGDSTRSLLKGSDRAGRSQPSFGPQTLLFTFGLPSPNQVPEAYPVPIRWEAGNRGWFSESEWPSGKQLTMTSGAREQVTQKSHAIQKLRNASVGRERETEGWGLQSIAGLMTEQEMRFERQAIFMRPWGDLGLFLRPSPKDFYVSSLVSNFHKTDRSVRHFLSTPHCLKVWEMGMGMHTYLSQPPEDHLAV